MKMSVQGWANLIVIPQGSMLTAKQKREIYNEFQVEIHIRNMPASQAAELGVDHRCKKLLMFGLSDNFEEAYAEAAKFMVCNGDSGIPFNPVPLRERMEQWVASLYHYIMSLKNSRSDWKHDGHVVKSYMTSDHDACLWLW